MYFQKLDLHNRMFSLTSLKYVNLCMSPCWRTTCCVYYTTMAAAAKSRSARYESLDQRSKKRYDDKIEAVGGLDPYVLEKSDPSNEF